MRKEVADTIQNSRHHALDARSPIPNTDRRWIPLGGVRHDGTDFLCFLEDSHGETIWTLFFISNSRYLEKVTI